MLYRYSRLRVAILIPCWYVMIFLFFYPPTQGLLKFVVLWWAVLAIFGGVTGKFLSGDYKPYGDNRKIIYLDLLERKVYTPPKQSIISKVFSRPKEIVEEYIIPTKEEWGDAFAIAAFVIPWALILLFVAHFIGHSITTSIIGWL